MTVKEILNKYNISEATIRNWKKLNYIDSINNIDPKAIDEIINNKANQRRNKRNSTDNIIPRSYVEDKKIIDIIQTILNLKDEYNISNNEILFEAIHYILLKNKKKMPTEVIQKLGNRSTNKMFIEEFNKIDINYKPNNDFLGCLYMSLLSIGKKDTHGIFYTPFKVVDKIVKSINFKKDSKIIDPGCGSGNFLIQAFKKMKSANKDITSIVKRLYGYDIDEIAVLLAKINIYILDDEIKYDEINVYVKDFLNDEIKEKFDIVIGNPPWGKKYTNSEKKKLEKKYGTLFAKQDSFSQFILKSFSIMNDNGALGFVLPSSILNIAVHKDIRSFLLEHDIKYIKKIGREFEEIVTDVIIIKVVKSKSINNKCIYDNELIDQTLFKSNPNFNFLVSPPIASSILSKMEKHPHSKLNKESIQYALGIVTGNNEKYITNIKSKNNEPIISGKEISKYNIDYTKIKNYITFDKDNLQQVAPEKLYRCKNKIAYKFIGKKLSFAVENKGWLTLNSANIICFEDDVNTNYLCAILNSRITQLFFEEKYDTHKVLKNHIQSFIIPEFSNEVKSTLSKLVQATKPTSSYNEKIEEIIYDNLKLSEEEISYLKGRF